MVWNINGFHQPIPGKPGGNYLWVVMCQLTSQVHLVPVNTMTKILELVYKFLNHIVCLHGLPMSIVSD